MSLKSQKLPPGPGSLPVTEALAGRVLSLPMYPELPLDHVEHVAEIVSRLQSGQLLRLPDAEGAQAGVEDPEPIVAHARERCDSLFPPVSSLSDYTLRAKSCLPMALCSLP